jgi:hypothetical protein
LVVGIRELVINNAPGACLGCAVAVAEVLCELLLPLVVLQLLSSTDRILLAGSPTTQLA